MKWMIGETVCDMHYGLPKVTSYPYERPVETRNHIRLGVEDSSEVFQKLLMNALGDRQGFLRTNKMAVIVGTGYDGWFVAAYSYDNHLFGMFEVRPLNQRSPE